MPTNNIGRSIIPFSITNDCRIPGPWYFFVYGNTNPIHPQGNTYFLSDLKGNCTKFQPNQKGKQYGQPMTVGSFTTNAFFPQLDAVRIYMSYGSQLTINTDANGIPIPPSADVPGDPNYQTLWDFAEATWHDYGDRTVLHVNTTQVDAFGLAFQTEHHGYDPSDPTKELTVVSGFHLPEARASIMSLLLACGAPWSNLVVPATSPTSPVRRALMPLKAMDLGHFPKDQLAQYILAVSKFYAATGPNRLKFDYGGVMYTGSTNNSGDFSFVPDKNKDNANQPTKTYAIKAPTTRQCYAQDILPQPNDGVGMAICAALGASYLRSTLMNFPDAPFPVPQGQRSLYYQKAPVCQYAKIIHSYGINNHAFCYGYDEVAGDAGANRDVVNPQWIKLTVQPIPKPS